MERLANAISDALATLGPFKTISLGRSQKHLGWFLPTTGLRMVCRSPEVLVFGDVLVAAALWPFGRARTKAVIVHGLDLTFAAPGYSALVRVAFRRIDRFLAISENTARLLKGFGVPESKIAVVYPGITVPAPAEATARQAARAQIGLSPETPLIIFVGRLVPRKGIAWFIQEVFPKVSSQVHLVVIGDGSDRALVEEAAANPDLGDRVHILGSVSESIRDLYIEGADLAVMPNIPTPSDPEGFGLVAVECTLRGTPVLGTNVDAVAEALANGECGFVIDPLDATTMTSLINQLIDDPGLANKGRRFAEVAKERFSEARFADNLAAALGLPPPSQVHTVATTNRSSGSADGGTTTNPGSSMV